MTGVLFLINIHKFLVPTGQLKWSVRTLRQMSGKLAIKILPLGI